MNVVILVSYLNLREVYDTYFNIAPTVLWIIKHIYFALSLSLSLSSLSLSCSLPISLSYFLTPSPSPVNSIITIGPWIIQDSLTYKCHRGATFNPPSSLYPSSKGRQNMTTKLELSYLYRLFKKDKNMFLGWSGGFLFLPDSRHN